MERMMDLEEMLRELSEKYKNSKSVEVYEEDLEGWFKIIDDLREENKKLKEKLSEITMVADDEKQSIEHILELEEENKNLTKCNLNLQNHIDKVEEENKKLNIKVASLEGEIKGLNFVIDKLKEENQTLELWLDRKEKLNEKYRKEIENKKLSTIAEETISDLQARIKELNEDIKKIEESQEYRYHRCMKAERGGEDED